MGRCASGGGEDVYACGRGAPSPSVGVAAGQEGAGAGAALPGAAAAVVAERARVDAFGEVAAALCRTPPFVSPALHADVVAADDQLRAVTYRRFAPLGSLKDAIGCSDPRASYGVKYGFLERAAALDRRRRRRRHRRRRCRHRGRRAAASVRRCRQPKWRCMGGWSSRRSASAARPGCRASTSTRATYCSKTRAAAAAGAAVLEAQPLAAASAGGVRGGGVELALLRLPAYSELLAKPRLPPGGGSFRVAREVGLRPALRDGHGRRARPRDCQLGARARRRRAFRGRPLRGRCSRRSSCRRRRVRGAHPRRPPR